MKAKELKDFLDEMYDRYNSTDFIESDPISIPRRFTRKQDIEISAFFASTIAWGQRPTIIRNANRLMQQMDESPYEFILHHGKKDLKPFESFVHRTFNGTDCLFYIRALKHLYLQNDSLEQVFTGDAKWTDENTGDAIGRFRSSFFQITHPARTRKHLSDPAQGSAAKRINMFLRWMVRKDNRKVDFGIWKNIPSSALLCPLDVHSGNVARKLGLLKRKQNDWKAVTELTASLRRFDPIDPVKYDFALFGLGVFTPKGLPYGTSF
jgi:uncharacterized protein (TIGR02757 family)